MKRLFKLIIISLISVLTVFSIQAQSDHVVIEEYSDYMTSAQYAQLNEDMQHIRDDYDIDIYFIYDTKIENTETAVKRYAEDFIAVNGSASNNVAIVMSSGTYYIAATGSAAAEVLKNETAIWNRFYNRASMISSTDPNAFYEGIRDAYQYIVKLVNGVEYQSNAPVSTLKALVNDYAGLLNDQEEEKLNRRLQNIKDKYGFDAVVLTTDSYNGMDVEDYADDFYDYSQYGQDGILFVWNDAEREAYIMTAGRAIDYFTDYGIDTIFDDMTDDLVNNRFYDAFTIYANRVDRFIENGQEGDIIDIDNTEPEPEFGIFNVIISAITGAVSSLITALSLKGRMRNTHRQTGARNYVVGNSFYINGASDMLVNRHVSRTRRPRNDDHRPTHVSSGSFGGGGSQIHTSSSGTTHGGHGRHF